MSENKNEKIEFDFNASDMIDTKAIADEVSRRLQDDITNAVVYKIRDHVEQQVTEALKPEIETLIKKQKKSILEEIAKAMPDIGKALATKMIATANEQLDGYYGKDILKKLFGA